MDSVTQFVLGASVGEAVAGKKAGNWAILWGGICGTIPDLDVFLRYFYNQVEMLGVHRGFTHSILFAILLAPILAYFQVKIHKKQTAEYKDWLWLSFWAVVTHPLLDSFTVYGTQLFQPFSNYPVAFNSIFIIDLVYTLPFIIGLLLILKMKRDSITRRKINNIVLIFTSFYLLLSVISKLSADSKFEENFSRNNDVIHNFSSPSPFNIILWNNIFITDDDKAHYAVYSHLDKNDNINYKSIERNSKLIENNLSDYPIQQLLWFSRGIYTIEEVDGEIFFIDLRFTRSDFYLEDDGEYIFKFKLIFKGNKVVSFDRVGPKSSMINSKAFGKLFERVLGE